jgi:hypothetical protein
MQEKQLPAGDHFWGSAQRMVRLSEGETYLPCHFYDVHYLVALFRTGKTVLQEILAGTGLKPGLYWKGDAVVAVGLIQYSRSDLGAYNEIIFSVPSIPLSQRSSILNWAELVGPLGRRSLGQYIFQIPVSARFSMIAGRELWGYPKRIAAIEHRFTPGLVDSRMKDDSGQIVMSCAGKLGFSLPSIPLSLVTYSFRDGKKLRTAVRVRGSMRWYPRQELVLRVGESGDPMAEDIRRLGLDGKKPFLVMDSPRFQAKFHEGEETGDNWS